MGFERRKRGDGVLASTKMKNPSSSSRPKHTIKRELFPNNAKLSKKGRRETPLITNEKYLVLSSKGPPVDGLSAKGHSSGRTGLEKPHVEPKTRQITNGDPSSSSTSWFWNKNVNWLLNRFKKCLEKQENLRPLTVRELSRADKVVPAGAIEAGLLVYAKNPSEFYIVIEKPMYYHSPQQSEWSQIFPAFKSGLEALKGVQVLLQLFCKSYKALGIDSKASIGPYKIGDLVAVKVIRKLKPSRSSENGKPGGEDSIDNVYEYQFNRGLITRTDDGGGGTDLSEYTVYCLDLGYEITVSDHFLLPLLKPFNLIPPLALRCGLYGISPAGEQWNDLSNDYVRHLLQNSRDACFSFEFCSAVSVPVSHMDVQSLTSSYLVNVEVRQFNSKTASLEYLFNFADEMIKSMYAVPWNLTPTRPKLMKGTTSAEVIMRNPTKKFDQVTLSFRTGLLLTKFHPKVYGQLTQKVISREIERLFMMRGHALTDVSGMHNRLVIILEDPGKRLRYPCSVNRLMGSEKVEEGESRSQS